MTLSVVLGTYNRLDQLKRCVESIFLETNIAVKVYITDAGSTDVRVRRFKMFQPFTQPICARWDLRQPIAARSVLFL